MIYEEPVIQRIGDCYVAVEFGDAGTLELSFRTAAVHAAMEKLNLQGIIEYQPLGRQLAAIYDREKTTPGKIEDAFREVLSQEILSEPIPSRLLEIPMWYDDPWSERTSLRFTDRKDIDYIAQLNGITVEELIRRHTETVWWNAAVGFAPGCNLHYALGDFGVTVNTYEKPRTWTPARTVGLAGSGTSSYPVETPGGSQLIGRMPIEIYDPGSDNPAFGPDGVLLRTGDRIKYVSIDPFEYDTIREQVVRGTYEYRIEEGTFDAQEYLESRGSA